MLPTMAGAANRCVIPEYKFDPDLLTKLLIEDREKNPSHYSVVLVSEGSMMSGTNEAGHKSNTQEQYGHSLHGGIGELVSDKISEISPKYQQLGYLVRGGDPDAIDSIVPMAYGNLALDLILKGIYGRLVVLRNGRYDNAPIDVVTSTNKIVDIKRYYNGERYRPQYKSFEFQPLFIMTGNS